MFNVKYDIQKIDTKSLSNFKNELNEIGKIVRRAIDKNFEVGGRSPKWPRKKSGAKSFLTSSKTLRKSFKQKIDKKSVVIFTKVAWAAVHNFGSVKKNIPKREFMKIFKDDVNKITKILDNKIIRVFKK